jgi:hypothetical protein
MKEQILKLDVKASAFARPSSEESDLEVKITNFERTSWEPFSK